MSEAITYTDVEALKQRLDDLSKVKDLNTEQVKAIIDQNQISKRGLSRVILALSSFPKPQAKKINSDHEAAVLRLLMEAKEIQLIMLMITQELSRVSKQQPEQITE